MFRRKPQRPDHERADDGHKGGWKQPPDPPFVKARQRELPALCAGQDVSGDQVSRDHEENVDTDEAAAEGGHFEVVEEHAEHGKRAQPVDVATIG
jgi:hypothetical protein